MTHTHKIAVVIPCYKVTAHILGVLNSIGTECSCIYVVDDKCPDGSGLFVEKNNTDARVHIIYHLENQGVGGAVMSGYKAAIDDGMDVIVKIDGDGQMDPTLMMDFVAPILANEADYTKGNRFYDLEEIFAMPRVRIIGNAILSLMSKFSSGYWNVFDPTNGFTAIHSSAAKLLPFHKISKRYFFETDMLFRLNTLKAVVLDVPMSAKYGDEISGLKISTIIGEFLVKHIRNTFKRIFYNYYLRDLTIASLELPLGVLLFTFGTGYGIYKWLFSAVTDSLTPSGSVMLAALPIIIGVQLLFSFLSYDIASIPRRTLQSTYFLRNKTRAEMKGDFLEKD